MKRGMTTMAAVLAGLLLTGACGAAKEVNEARKSVGDIKEAAENLEKGTTGDKKLDAILARAEKAEGSTFKATYKISDGGSGSTLEIAQKGKKSKWAAGDGSSRVVFVDDGTDLYSCFPFGEDGEMQCTEGKGEGGQGSVAATAIAFSPATMLASIKGILPLLGASLEVEHFSDTKAGRDVECVRFTYKDESSSNDGPDVFCITEDGIWAYSESADGDTIELVEFSDKVDDDEFEVPGKVIDPSEGYPDPDAGGEG